MAFAYTRASDRLYTLLIAIAALLLSLAAHSRPAAVDAAAPHWCECVEYVKTYFGLKGAAGNAKDMAPFLLAHGFRRLLPPYG